MTDEVKTGLPPIAPPDARLFILGSLPGDASLAAAQYYAHPQNQFWRLVGSVIGEDLHALPYPERLARLAEHRIGLWDVIGSAIRRGSLDQAIRLANHNRIEQLIHDFPDLEAIAFNGATSATAGRKLIGTEHRRHAHRPAFVESRQYASLRGESRGLGTPEAFLRSPLCPGNRVEMCTG